MGALPAGHLGKNRHGRAEQQDKKVCFIWYAKLGMHIYIQVAPLLLDKLR